MENHSNLMHRFDTLKDFMFLKVMWLCFCLKRRKGKIFTFQPQRVAYCREASCIINCCLGENEDFCLSGYSSPFLAVSSWLFWVGFCGTCLSLSFFPPFISVFVLMALFQCSVVFACCVLCQTREWHCNVTAGGLLSCHWGFSASPGTRKQT